MTAGSPNYSGMTVNERLFEAGLMAEYQAAARARNRDLMISVLTRVALSKEDAAFTADAVLANPARYGY